MHQIMSLRLHLSVWNIGIACNLQCLTQWFTCACQHALPKPVVRHITFPQGIECTACKVQLILRNANFQRCPDSIFQALCTHDGKTHLQLVICFVPTCIDNLGFGSLYKFHPDFICVLERLPHDLNATTLVCTMHQLELLKLIL